MTLCSKLSECLNEARTINGVTLKMASAKDRAKGETYSVVSKTEKKYIAQGKALAQGLTRDSAKALAATNPDWDYVSSSFAQDQGYSGALNVEQVSEGNVDDLYGKSFKLVEQPDGQTTRFYKLTVGKYYKIQDIVGSNAYITTDDDNYVSISLSRFDLKNPKK